MSASSLVLGLDPGFASFGWALVRLECFKHFAPVGITPTAMGVVLTEKSTKKQKVLSADDDERRACQIADALDYLVRTHNPQVLCAESWCQPRNAASAAKLARAWGVLTAVRQTYRLPLVCANPKEIKLALCGKSTASKTEIQAKLEATWRAQDGGVQRLDQQFLAGLPAREYEHPFDALAAIYACSDSEIIRALFR